MTGGRYGGVEVQTDDVSTSHVSPPLNIVPTAQAGTITATLGDGAVEAGAAGVNLASVGLRVIIGNSNITLVMVTPPGYPD
jgi:hypothetical protein